MASTKYETFKEEFNKIGTGLAWWKLSSVAERNYIKYK